MSYDDFKAMMLDKSEVLIKIARHLSYNNTAEKIQKYRQAISDDMFIVTVVGEFNRGKSTLINAIMGCNVIPTSIRPTTATINIIHYSKEPVIEIHKTSGEVERIDFTSDAFQDYTALKAFDASSVKYVRVGYPISYLKDGTVLVDTPGVNDINEQRLTITYGYLPNSDAVLFLMNASTPFKSTEKEFLETHVLGNKVKKVFFLINRIDELSDGDVNESITEIKKQLKDVIKTDDFKVYPISSIRALKGIMLHDKELIKASRVESFTSDLKEFLTGPEKVRTKIDRLKMQLQELIALLTDDIDFAITQYQLSEKQLITAVQQLDIEDVLLREHFARLIQYVRDNVSTLERNVESSLLKSIQELSENLTYQIERARGDLTEFAERDIPFIIKKHLNLWHESTQPKISQYSNSIQQKAISGFTEHFSKKPIISSIIGTVEDASLIEGLIPMNPSANKNDRIKNIKQKSFLIGAASLGILATIATGGIGYPALMAVIGGGSIGQRFLGEKWMNEEIEKQRSELHRNIPGILQEIYQRYYNGFTQEIQHKFTHFISELDREFQTTMNGIKDELESGIASKAHDKDEASARMAELIEYKTKINKILEEMEVS
ncbi:MAG: dynamin family protein [Candidatus Cloacimonadaceae bacterium]|nr:dynamin family protein [Candidatus Cloacimonadaceae bacterium]